MANDTLTITPNAGGKTFDVVITREDGTTDRLRPKYRTPAAARAAIALWKSGTYISIR